MEEKPNQINNKCQNINCIGGRGFRIRDKLFCSPNCGHIYFNLSKRDKDYWPNDEPKRKK